ncbi:MAG: MurR/RpiR family transcriptional regulator [Pseudomonadota bacterium]
MPITPTTAEDVLQALTEAHPELSPQLRLAARFIIDQPREVGVNSMRALAARAEVHPNTLVRLAQAIGFEGYEELRERFRDFVVTGALGGFAERARFLQRLEAEGGTSELIAGLAAATMTNLEDLWTRNDPGAMDAAADRLLGAGQVMVLGLGAADSLANQFAYVARMAFGHVRAIPSRASVETDDIQWLGPGDLLIAMTFQPYRSETLAGAQQALDQGAEVLGITDSPASPLTRLATQTLSGPTHTPQFFVSNVAITALLEGLTATCVARAGETARARIEEFHARRQTRGIYEDPPRLPRTG